MSCQPKLLEQVRGVMRTRNYSPRTIATYVQWIKRFILFHNKTNPAAWGAIPACCGIRREADGGGDRENGGFVGA